MVGCAWRDDEAVVGEERVQAAAGSMEEVRKVRKGKKKDEKEVERSYIHTYTLRSDPLDKVDSQNLQARDSLLRASRPAMSCSVYIACIAAHRGVQLVGRHSGLNPLEAM